jgi:hypothetical protein
MKWVIAMLKRLGFMRTHTDEDVFEAFTEEASRAFEENVKKMEEATQKRKEGNEALRSAIGEAKRSSSVQAPPFEEFTEFERFLRVAHRKRRKANYD